MMRTPAIMGVWMLTRLRCAKASLQGHGVSSLHPPAPPCRPCGRAWAACGRASDASTRARGRAEPRRASGGGSCVRRRGQQAGPPARVCSQPPPRHRSSSGCMHADGSPPVGVLLCRASARLCMCTKQVPAGPLACSSHVASQHLHWAFMYGRRLGCAWVLQALAIHDIHGWHACAVCADPPWHCAMLQVAAAAAPLAGPACAAITITTTITTFSTRACGRRCSGAQACAEGAATTRAACLCPATASFAAAATCSAVACSCSCAAAGGRDG